MTPPPVLITIHTWIYTLFTMYIPHYKLQNTYYAKIHDLKLDAWKTFNGITSKS